MQISLYFNLGSIICGLIAWALPCIAVFFKNPRWKHGFSIFSFTFCTFALLLQLIEIRHRVRISDWAAIDDTIGAIILSSAFLIVVSVILNLRCLWKKKMPSSPPPPPPPKE